MRKVVASTFVSVDGVFEDPGGAEGFELGGWSFKYVGRSDDDMNYQGELVELNRAVAVAMAFGPEAGLELVNRLGADPSLPGYHLLPSVRGDLLAKARPPARGANRIRAGGGSNPERARAKAADRARRQT